MTNEQLLEQIQALKELISIQKQTIDALKALPPKIEYRYTYYQPYYSQPYIYGGAQGGTGVTVSNGTGYVFTNQNQCFSSKLLP